MVIQSGKSSSKFLSVFDDLVPPSWCERAYKYATELRRPWGAYVTTAEVLDEQLSEESLWESNPEKAISLLVTRKLFFGRGRGFLEKDINRIHGIQCGLIYLFIFLH
jgi:hypothetical protein